MISQSDTSSRGVSQRPRSPAPRRPIEVPAPSRSLRMQPGESVEQWDERYLSLRSLLDDKGALKDAPPIGEGDIDAGDIDDILTPTQMARFIRTIRRVPAFGRILARMLGAANE